LIARLSLKELTMKLISGIATALLVVAAGSSLQPANAQSTGIHRTDLVKQDLSAPGREGIQVKVDFDPGEEIAYVLQGTLEYRLDDRPPVTLKAGDALFIPAGTVHSARNVGDGNASELATYIVRKGEPLVVPAH
jgi:quercetin dioxygenase-like cupin family protein